MENSAMEEVVDDPDTIFEEYTEEVTADTTEPASSAEPTEQNEPEEEEDNDDDDDLDDDMLEELLNAPESGDEDDDGVLETETGEEAMEATDGNGTGTADTSKAQTDKLVRLPLSRIKQIIKLDDEVDRVNGDAVFIIAKAAEMFVQSFTKEIYKITERSKKKTIQLRDLNMCIEEVMCMQFLEGCFLEQL